MVIFFLFCFRLSIKQHDMRQINGETEMMCKYKRDFFFKTKANWG